ncbi:MAG: NADH-quinone oxidoreductase subunit F, partial [Oscillospiraceae bacterium]|nr:NADH-quinone oxidoreductase subunit F [Oscillospiraceae bacterium]
MKIVVGQGSCGIASGAAKTSAEFEKLIAERGLGVAVEKTGCIGNCYLEPIVDIRADDGALITRYVHVQPEIAQIIVERHIIGGEIVSEYAIDAPDEDFLGAQKRIVLRNAGVIDPESIDAYLAAGGYEAVKKALGEMSSQDIIDEVKLSGLRGRGGAGFPTWFKWNAARENASDEKYMVCNADEGDPGAFMDRSVLEGDPHSVLEGMTIGGYVIGAGTGVIYVRAEYPLAIARLEKAIEQARERGCLGRNIFGSGFDFDIYIKAGAGAFVCGEETALIASLEGERGMPRLKPPFPAQKGYWKQPTNINNVETFANIPWIISNGGAAFAAIGTEQSHGTKVFALAGKIQKGGLVEIPMGLP